MRLSLSFLGIAPVESTLAAVRAAERLGLDGVWSAEHIGFRDAIVPSAVYLRESRRLEVGVVGISAAGRHPGLLAMELSTLAELAPGRLRVQVGTGDPALVAKLGRRIEHAARSTEAFVATLREALAGRELEGDHAGHSFHGFRLVAPAPPPPVDVMAVGPRMLHAAARVGDGVSLSVGASAAYLARTVRDVEADLAALGRDRGRFRITAFALAAIGDDLEAAGRQVASLLLLLDPRMLEQLARDVLEPGALAAAVRAEGPAGALRCLAPEVVDDLALVTPRRGLADALARYAATGIDELAVSILGGPDDQAALVEALAQARPAA